MIDVKKMREQADGRKPMNLNLAERARPKRNHGITVTRECEGAAHCLGRNGDRQQYAIEHLKECAKPSVAWRLRQWILGVNHD